MLFKPQCFSFWLLVHLIPFCTRTFLPTPGSSLFCLLSVWHSVSCFFWPRLHCFWLWFWIFSSGTFALLDCSLVLTSVCVLDLSACPIKHLPLELHPESAHGSSVPDSDTRDIPLRIESHKLASRFIGLFLIASNVFSPKCFSIHRSCVKRHRFKKYIYNHCPVVYKAVSFRHISWASRDCEPCGSKTSTGRGMLERCAPTCPSLL